MASLPTPSSENQETEQFNYKRILYYVFLVGGSLVLIAAGFVIEHLSDNSAAATEKFWAHFASFFITELGIAGLIAWLLSVTIEKLSRQEFARLAARHQDLIKENVFHYVYGQSLPDKVVGEIESQLLRCCFVKHNMSVKHTITHYLPDNRLVILTTQIEYEVENISRTAQVFNCGVLTDDVPEASLKGEAKILGVRFQVGGNDADVIDGSTIADHCSNSSVGGHIHFQKRYTIPGKAKARFSTLIRCIKRLTNDSDVFLSNDPVCGFSIVIDADVELGLEFTAHSFHPEEFSEGIGHSPQNGHYHWQLERPILRSQGGFVSWTQKPKLQPLVTLTENAIDARHTDTVPPPT